MIKNILLTVLPFMAMLLCQTALAQGGQQDDGRGIHPLILLQGNAADTVERLREQINETSNDQEKLTLLVQLIAQLQNLGALDETARAYEQLFELDFMENPNVRLPWVLRFGRHLTNQGFPRRAANLYRSFLDEIERTADERIQIDIAGVHSAWLSALIDSGDYREAAAVADEILQTTSEIKLDGGLLDSFLELAENDQLGFSQTDTLETLLFRDNAYLYFLPRLVRVYIDQGRKANAAATLDRLLKEKPGFFLSSIDELTQLYLAANGAGAQEKFVASLEEISVDPGNRETLRLLEARWLDRTGQSDKAIEQLKQLPLDYRRCQEELARIYFSHGNYEQAAEVYRKLLSRVPHQIEYLKSLGQCYYFLKRPEDAVNTWEKIPLRLGQSSAAYRTLADIYSFHGMNNEAIETLEKARRTGGGSTYEVNGRIIDLLLQAEQYERALKEYASISREQKGLQPAYQKRIVDAFENSPESAKTFLEQLSDVLNTVGNVQAKMLLKELAVDLYSELGQYNDAIEFIQRFYPGENERAVQLYRLGVRLSAKGAVNAAVRAWALVPEQGPYGARVRTELARLSLSLGQFEQARDAALSLVAEAVLNRPTAHDLAPEDLGSVTEIDRRLEGLDAPERRRAAFALVTLAEVDLLRKKPGEALRWLLPLKNQIELHQEGVWNLLAGHAYSQLGSLETAEEHYERAFRHSPPGSKERNQASFYLGETYLWQEKVKEAMNQYFDLASKTPEGPFSNEAIRRYMVTAFAPAEQLYHYTMATRMAWGGDYPEAIRLFREAAADDAESDIAGWCLYEAARLLDITGQREEAARQIEHVLERYEHPTLKAECVVLQTKMETHAAAPQISSATEPFVDILERFPNTLYADLSRLKLEGRLEQPF